ncbi:hypothetical protein [Flavobacterium saliperosum]|uniref:YhhN-like protein n=1 Tax=Flavobacterium saliperosum TaxID=329186 RepID=A0A1G4VE59_9FLAO|nr:hypothetical protein [Flavobacterium saliperosum]SCX05363.1 hypothetical protein SAMN02927925_00805 [Flavobacterium saliperosum]
MDKSTPALILYFAASLVYVLSIVLELDTVITFLFKPMIAPAIFFYYWQESKGKILLIPSLVLLLFYIGDMMILIEYENLLVSLMILNLIAYMFLGSYLTKDLLKINNPKISSYTFLIICLIIVFLLSLLYLGLSIVFRSTDSNYGLLIVYGVTLVLLGIEAVTYYILKNDEASFFILLTIFSLVISDLFYVLYNHYAQFNVFVNINVFCQVLSLYFVIKYFLYRSHQNTLENS